MKATPTRPGTAVGTARHAARRVLARHPTIFLPVSRRRQPQSTLAPDTQLVIDGFTRSASTFAVVAFQLAQNDHVRVAHHLHAAAHLIAAVRAGVPTLMPIRPPRETVLSASIREPTVSVSQWLRTFADFYRRVEPLLDQVVVATFESVTTDMGGVTDRVNERFGTSFARFESTDESLATVFEVIDERSRRPPWQQLLGEFLAGGLSWDEYRAATESARATSTVQDVPESRVQRPTASREHAKQALSSVYDAPALAGARRAAEHAYAAVARAAR